MTEQLLFAIQVLFKSLATMKAMSVVVLTALVALTLARPSARGPYAASDNDSRQTKVAFLQRFLDTLMKSKLI